MGVSQPLSKEQLKKLILRSMHNNEEAGQPVGWDVVCILGLLVPRLVEIEEQGLSEKEYTLGTMAIMELERDGFIIPDPTQRSVNFKILTDKGKIEAKKT